MINSDDSLNEDLDEDILLKEIELCETDEDMWYLLNMGNISLFLILDANHLITEKIDYEEIYKKELKKLHAYMKIIKSF